MFNDPELPKWSFIQSLIPQSTTGKPDLHKFSQAHETTYRKFKFAIYHLNILRQVYGPNATVNLGRGTSSASQQHWAIAEAHSIVFNLYSALDSVSDEINRAYEFKLNPNEVGVQSIRLQYMI
jgi:hypothetical protein